jgi:hypothetical protein
MKPYCGPPTSEAFIFATESQTVIGQIVFVLWLLNMALAYYSFMSNQRTSLTLRFAYPVVLIARL